MIDVLSFLKWLAQLAVVVVICGLSLVSCDFRPLGKDAVQFILDDTSSEYIDWKILPRGGKSNEAIKMKFLDTNTYVCRSPLPPGEYEVHVRKKGQAYTSIPVTIEKGKWNYHIASPGSGDVVVTKTINLTGMIGNPGISRIYVLFKGSDISLQSATLQKGHFSVATPLKKGQYQLSIYAPGDPPLEWNNTVSYSFTSDLELGTLTLK